MEMSKVRVVGSDMEFEGYLSRVEPHVETIKYIDEHGVEQVAYGLCSATVTIECTGALPSGWFDEPETEKT